MKLKLALILAAASIPSLAQAANAPVVEAERAFAKTASEKGIGPAFRMFAAEDALVFLPDPKPAKPVLIADGDPPGTLSWWPVYAGMAASGDLGFTTGPYVSDNGRKKYGWYFTIWRRQPDGTWRWVIDQAPPTDNIPHATPVGAVRMLPTDKVAAMDAELAWDEVKVEEERLGLRLAVDAPRALLGALAPDARVMRAGPQPAMGRAAFSPLIAAGPAAIMTKRLGGATSAAGDLAFTYGQASWETAGATTTGHYVRVWQRRAKGWQIVVDELIPVPPPKQAAAGADPAGG